jgi:uncharacterized membrane protein YozB (DUF420 family)
MSLTPGLVILVLKIAVAAVTVLLLASLVALAKGNIRLHGRINLAFFVLTLAAVLGLEFLIRVIDPRMFEEYLVRHEAQQIMRIHLIFSIPSALLLPLMLFTGLKRHRNLHVAMAIVFLILWTGTFVTGIFYLPHEM